MNIYTDLLFVNFSRFLCDRNDGLTAGTNYATSWLALTSFFGEYNEHLFRFALNKAFLSNNERQWCGCVDCDLAIG